MNRVFIIIMAAGLLVLAACSSPVSQTEQPGVAFPTRAQYLRVVNTLDGQRINQVEIVRVFGNLGVRRPDSVMTEETIRPDKRYSDYATTLRWEKRGDYSVVVLFGYNNKDPFSATDPTSGLHSYVKN